MKKRNLVLGMLLIILLALSTSLIALTYTVTEIADNGTGATVGSLSWAITQSNASTSVDDNIAFNLSSGSTVTINAVLPIITDAVTIDGNDGGTHVTVKVTTPGAGGSEFRVFKINAYQQTINISNMTIKGGDISANVGIDDGLGGGINHYNGILNLDTVTVSDSKAYDVGGIYAKGQTSTTSLNLENCTVSSNTASRNAGGIKTEDDFSMSNSTISNNVAGGDVGGIWVTGSSGSNTITINNSTIANNTSAQFSGSPAGFSNNGSVNNITIKNSIFANNSHDSGAEDDYNNTAGTFTDGGYNVVGYSSQAANGIRGFDASTSILYNTQYNNSTTSASAWTQGGTSVSGSLELATSVADNGGNTQTLSLATTSFAAGGSSNAIPYGSSPYWNGSPSADQRGTSRSVNKRTSIGAYSDNYGIYYMAKSGGLGWSNLGTWKTSLTYSVEPDDYTTAASEIPNASNSDGIIINVYVPIEEFTTISIDQTTVNSGATLMVNNDSAYLTVVDDGTAAVDLISNGELLIWFEGLNIASGASVEANGRFDGDMISFDDGGDNDGTLSITYASPAISWVIPGNGTITYDGAGQTICAISYNDLVISGSAEKTLGGAINVNGNLTLEEDLNLNGQTITLGASANLIESTGNIYGTSGTIQTTRDLSNIDDDIAGLGAEITTSEDMGSTTIIRGHTAQTSGENTGIKRYYDITPANNSSLNATLVFHYNDADIAVFSESGLLLWKSINGGTNWTIEGGIVDIGENTITLSGLDGFSRWTASDNEAPLPVTLSSFYALYIGGTPTLYWTTQTETDNAYWNVYRGTSNSFEAAALLNASNHVPGNGTTNSASDYVYVDTMFVVQNATYWYWIEDVSTDGETVVHEPITLSIPFEDVPITPDTYGLQQNYPNPFNPSTSISFALAEDSNVKLVIYNVKGEKVKSIFSDHVYADEIHTAIWNGNDKSGKAVSSGVYLYKLITDTKEYNKKMLMVK